MKAPTTTALNSGWQNDFTIYQQVVAVLERLISCMLFWVIEFLLKYSSKVAIMNANEFIVSTRYEPSRIFYPYTELLREVLRSENS